MANTVKLKRSATPSAVPTTGQLDLGEVAINTYDGKMYIKKDDGTAAIVEVTGSTGAAGQGVPVGGTTGQLLAKSSGTDYATQWVNVGELDTYKLPVRGATTANITLSGNVVMDGMTTAPGDRILVKDQTNGSENGIYVASAGAWSRASDFDSNAKVQNGVMVPVKFGTANVGSIWMLSLGSSAITLGSTVLGFTKIVRADDVIGRAQGGTGLTTAGASGNVLTSDGTNWTSAAPAGGGSVFYKDPVRAATTANGTLATSFQNGSNIDGVALATGNRILIKNQSNGVENGIYVVNATGAPTRAADMNENSEAQRGCMVYVQFGNTHGGSNWQIVAGSADPAVIGTSSNLWMPVQGIAGRGMNGWTAPNATGATSVAIGSAASSTATDCIAIGNTVRSSGGSSIAIGSNISAGSTSGSQLSIGSNIVQGTGAAGSTVIGSYNAGSGQITNCTIISPIGRSASNAASNIWLHHCTLIGGFTGVLNSGIAVSTALGELALAEMSAEITFGVGIFGERADKKISFIGAHTTTTNATVTEIGTATPNNTAAATPTGRIVLTNDSTYLFDCDIVARNTTTDTESKVWNLKFGIRRGTSAANTGLIGNATKTVYGEDIGTSAWDVSVSADTTNGRPNISVTGEASKTIRWVANIRMTKVSG